MAVCAPTVRLRGGHKSTRRSARLATLVELKGWVLTMLSESMCCCCAVFTHIFASLRELDSHPSRVLHHTAA